MTDSVAELIAEIVELGRNEFQRVMERNGSQGLWKFLHKTDFFKAPASCYHHASFVGGLAVHSWQVYQNLRSLAEKYPSELGHFTEEQLFLVTYFHDLCKCKYYAKGWKWYKDEEETNNRWEKKDFWKVDDQIPLGHGERSVFMLQQFVPISVEEACAIRYHLGYIDNAAHNGWPCAMQEAWKMFPSSILAHLADMETAVSESEDKFLYAGKWYEVPRAVKFKNIYINKILENF